MPFLQKNPVPRKPSFKYDHASRRTRRKKTLYKQKAENHTFQEDCPKGFKESFQQSERHSQTFTFIEKSDSFIYKMAVPEANPDGKEDIRK